MRALEWIEHAKTTIEKIQKSQSQNIKEAASIMANSIAAERWVHTFGCGHATLPVEEMYPRIGGFVGFHPVIELPLSFFTHIIGDMGINQFVFLERIEGYGQQIMKSYNLHPDDTMWIFSHSGINNVNIDVALYAKKVGMKVIATGSVEEFRNKKSRHSSGKNLFEIADVTIDTCVPAQDAVIEIENHIDRIAPLSTLAFITVVWTTIITVAEILVEKGVKLFIHPSHNIPGDNNAMQRLQSAINEYRRRLKV
ncbi:MAG: SIS domain-containing protein [Candidatus Neomarinimicrobiota bacterium]|nr:MAG: SIS domain-containing protein [Candidatus Neomarinimicrobiota bacterium]